MVTTDDADWVRSKRVFDGMVLSQGLSPAEDMSINAACRCPAPVLDERPVLTAACRHMIMSLGTFGWWGAFLNGQAGFIIYWIVPFNWDAAFENNAAGHNSSQFYLPAWIPKAAEKD